MVKFSYKELIEDISNKDSPYISLWIESLIGGSQIVPVIPKNDLGEDLLLKTSKEWLLLAEIDTKHAKSLEIFREKLFDTFLRVSKKNSQTNNPYFVDIPTQLNRYVYFFRHAPEYYAEEYKLALGSLLTVKNSYLLKWVYGDDRVIYFALLDVFIKWSNALPNERISGYEKPFIDFLFDNIETFNDSGYCQVAFKYFSSSISQDNFFNFLEKSYKCFQNNDDLYRLSESFYLLFSRRGEIAKDSIIGWLIKLNWVPAILVDYMSNWFEDLSLLLVKENVLIFEHTPEEQNSFERKIANIALDNSEKNYEIELSEYFTNRWESLLVSIASLLKEEKINERNIYKFELFFIETLKHKEEKFIELLRKYDIVYIFFEFTFLSNSGKRCLLHIQASKENNYYIAEGSFNGKRNLDFGKFMN